METRSRARTREGQSSSPPVRLLEDSESRPSSRASGSEGDLGLSTLLGVGEASIVGRGQTSESATSGSCNLTLVAEQVPDRGPELESLHVPVTDMDTTSLQIVTIPLCYQGHVLKPLQLEWSLWQHSPRTRSDQCRSLHNNNNKMLSYRRETALQGAL